MVEDDCVDNCFVLTNGMSTILTKVVEASFEFTHEASHPPHRMEGVCIDKGFLLPNGKSIEYSSACTPLHRRPFPAPFRAAVKQECRMRADAKQPAGSSARLPPWRPMLPPVTFLGEQADVVGAPLRIEPNGLNQQQSVQLVRRPAGPTGCKESAAWWQAA
jgi:hypothetical protein